MVLVLFFPFQLPKFGSFDLPPQILVIAPLGLCPTAAKGEEKPFPFREGTLTLPMTVSALVLCSVAKCDCRIILHVSEWQGRFGDGGAGCRCGKAGG